MITYLPMLLCREADPTGDLDGTIVIDPVSTLDPDSVTVDLSAMRSDIDAPDLTDAIMAAVA